MNTFITLKQRNRIADALRRDQAPLLPASIDEAVDGKISYANLEKGLTIRFPFVEGMRVGGTYLVVIEESLEGDALFGSSGAVREENRDIVVPVPADRALDLKGQEVLLYYFFIWNSNRRIHRAHRCRSRGRSTSRSWMKPWMALSPPVSAVARRKPQNQSGVVAHAGRARFCLLVGGLARLPVLSNT
nr:hypothetical protein GCM10020185_31130 [Pseudomonas brassicacearum subsp. brassicacearum]